MELFVAAGTTTAIGTRFYSYNGQTIAVRNAQKGLSWLLSDNQNTSYASVAAATLNYTKRWQDPYGVTRGTAASTWPDKRGYLGGYQNPTGLTHLGTRDYDPAAGRFSSVDPVLSPDQPQHLNGYTYGFGNPVLNTDASGMEPLPEECAGTKSPDCANFYYGVDTKENARYDNVDLALVRTCNWSRDCVFLKNQDINQKGSRPTKERIEAIYHEYHGEGATPEQLAQLGWTLTGIPDVLDCLEDPTWGGCLLAAIGIVPFFKLGKLGKVADVARVVGNSVDVVIDPLKWKYVFGEVTSGLHNTARSNQNAVQFARVGIENNDAGRAFLQGHLEEAARADNNIVRTYDDKYGTHQVRDSLIAGQWGFIHLESTWGLSGGSMKFESLIPRGGR